MDAPLDQPSLRFTRHFDVAPEIVFDTLSTPELMKVWWGANVEFDIDLRLGGKWTIIRREDGEEYLATGIFLQVDRPWKLQYTYSMPEFSDNSDTITVQIEALDKGCSVTFEQAGEDIAEEVRAQAPGGVTASEADWQLGFDLMETAWSEII